MEPMTTMAIAAGAGAAGNIIGGIMGNKAQKKALAQQMAMWNARMAEYDKLGYPPEVAKDIIKEEMRSVGMYTPELEQAIEMDSSALANLKEDQSMKNIQLEALKAIQKRGQEGLTAQERTAMNQLRSEVERDEQARQQSIMQNMQARGMGGSGAELAAILSSSQAATQRQAEGADRLSALAAQNALQALAQSGTMAGGIRSQDLDVEMTKAKAADAMKEFNLQNAIARQQRNILSKNQAQAANLAQAQKIADFNLLQRNEEIERKANRDIVNYMNRLNFLNSKHSGLSQGMDLVGKQGELAANKYSAIGSALGNLATTLGQAYVNNAYREQDRADRNVFSGGNAQILPASTRYDGTPG